MYKAFAELFQFRRPGEASLWSLRMNCWYHHNKAEVTSWSNIQLPEYLHWTSENQNLFLLHFIKHVNKCLFNL